MSDVSIYLSLFDAAWGHAYESLQDALKGVSEAEAAYQAPCYSTEAREEGWPEPGTIAWQVAHLIHCKRHYTEHFLRAASGQAVQETPWVPIESFADLCAALENAHGLQRQAIAALEPEWLERTAGNGMTYHEFLAMVIRHDTWHASQIAVARRGYRHRSER